MVTFADRPLGSGRGVPPTGQVAPVTQLVVVLDGRQMPSQNFFDPTVRHFLVAQSPSLVHEPPPDLPSRFWGAHHVAQASPVWFGIAWQSTPSVHSPASRHCKRQVGRVAAAPECLSGIDPQAPLIARSMGRFGQSLSWLQPPWQYPEIGGESVVPVLMQKPLWQSVSAEQMLPTLNAPTLGVQTFFSTVGSFTSGMAAHTLPTVHWASLVQSVGGSSQFPFVQSWPVGQRLLSVQPSRHTFVFEQ